jgi:hypothetical protein
MLVGANLEGTYGLGQVHFHWGSNMSRGSEHIIDGHQYVCQYLFENDAGLIVMRNMHSLKHI